MNLVRKPHLKNLPLLLHFLLFLLHFHFLCSYGYYYTTQPLRCTDTSRVCTSFLAFKPRPNQTLALVQSMFDVLPNDVTVEEGMGGYIFIRKNCSCAAGMKKYVSNTTFTVKSSEGFVDDLVMKAYDGLSLWPNTSRRRAKNGAVIAVRLFCGCSSGPWNYMVSYVMREGDSVASLASRFGVSMDSIEMLNGIKNPDNVTVGSLYYIPLNSVPGEPYSLKNDTSSAPIPAPSIDTHSDIRIDAIEVENPVVFTFEEIFSSTDGFSDSNLLGNGTYGSVYYGFLRDQEVAIKRMTATKTKEFLAEMKVLCKVHHANLVELIGYAASHDELFLIYEYAQKGSLGSHFHDTQTKGSSSLSWIMRVQIALDAARGLEYIHEHTKTHYVHRDIKTSNILLDASFRAKISDFGLAKLVGKVNEGEIKCTKVVGTYGYLAPEYLSNGFATTKSDVYAFGIVLFEIISGKGATIRTEGTVTKNPERRSLASIMLAALRNSPDSMSMSSLRDHIDPNMMDLYPHDCVFKMGILAKQCVDDDPILRPDMKQVVISLSQILLSSIEWEATLAGNSQVFSGLVQGR
ncbi:lysM domain receptor-like kinase 3 [Senna tora]|uniref:LysM domain receptor-like kinase 3 n=1 Tax=Senna tora TaxID=362788 RepID=A0A834T3Y4_9FABA|nr:lysM domain receptor-like kinase 3 [Senna tora]